MMYEAGHCIWLCIGALYCICNVHWVFAGCRFQCYKHMMFHQTLVVNFYEHWRKFSSRNERFSKMFAAELPKM